MKSVAYGFSRMNVEVGKDYKWDAILRERGQQLIQLLYKAFQVTWGDDI